MVRLTGDTVRQELIALWTSPQWTVEQVILNISRVDTDAFGFHDVYCSRWLHQHNMSQYSSFNICEVYLFNRCIT